ncbi:hypothetical protein Fcan01_23932 [Folsomia candida]|uniref:Uncharacterized protein n=1 Tax=Folsomia candida TaxID=158441 RepID=A0A226D692_FOLCA|nr:hypothetical protein Fcan01_23932 [Folsomia candida]
MGHKINPEVEISVLILLRSGSSQRDIQKHLKCSDIQLSKGAIHKIIHGLRNKRNTINAGLPIPSNNDPPKKASKTVIRKIDRLTSKENPPGQRTIANMVKLSQRHTPTRQIGQPPLGACCNGTRKICYTRSQEEAEKFGCPKREKFSEKIMVLGAITSRGVLHLIKVSQNTKISYARYVNDVLKPLLKKKFQNSTPQTTTKLMYITKKRPITLPHIPSDTKKTLRSGEAQKLSKNTLIHVKSPNISPMDFFGFGHLKQKMFNKYPSTKNGFWKLLQDEWRKITPEMCQGVFSAWKKRCRTVAQVHGEHIEQIKDIHRHRI